MIKSWQAFDLDYLAAVIYRHPESAGIQVRVFTKGEPWPEDASEWHYGFHGDMGEYLIGVSGSERRGELINIVKEHCEGLDYGIAQMPEEPGEIRFEFRRSRKQLNVLDY